MPVQSANPPEPIILWEWTGTGQGSGGVNQSAGRTVIDDQELWWMENYFPIQTGELRTAWGPSAPIWTAGVGQVILRLFCTCIDGVNPVGFAFTNDGIVTQFPLQPGGPAPISLGRVWSPVTPNWWCDLKLWAPRQFGNTAGQSGGVVIGSPAGLYAWDGQNLSSPGETPPLWLTGGATTDSSGNPLVMPSGLPGIYAMEVYLQRLFVMGQTVISMSAPGNAIDFSTGSGGGSWGYYGDQLTVSYTDLAATYGLLYVFGDSSVQYVSGLQLVGAASPIGTIYTTQFNFANFNPQIGHRVFRPVGHWLQDLICFDGAGLFDLNQSGMVWISNKLTNLVQTWNGTWPLAITAATIFGQRWLLVSGYFTDPWGVARFMILCWNGSVWTIASQGIPIIRDMASFEQNSVITPYATDGQYVYQLFAQPSSSLLKRLNTKAYMGKGEMELLTVKDWKRVYVEMTDKSSPAGGVSIVGTYSAAGGGVPGGSVSVSFAVPPGVHETVPHPTEGKGLSAWLDLTSLSPDFTIARISLTYELRTLYGA